MAKRLLVLVVDRDDDLGTKAGIKGPVVGEEENMRAAEALILEDPEDSDANTIFAAIKTARELRKQGNIVEIATLTGHPSLGFLADSKIHEQLKEVLNRFEADGVVFVTDGAEDDQVIPIITSHLPILSKKTVIVRQAAQLERTFYIIKHAIKDKDLAPIFLGIPGIIILLWAVLGNVGLKLIFGIIGTYLVLLATGLDEAIKDWVTTVFKGISLHGKGAVFYIASIALLVVAGYSAYQNYLAIGGDLGVYEAARSAIGFASLSAILYLIGRSVDAHFEKKAYLIGKYIRYAAVTLLFWLMADIIIRILERTTAITDLYWATLAGIIFYIITVRLSDLFEETIKTSEKIVGAKVMDRRGGVGRIVAVDEERGIVRIQMGKKRIDVPIAKILLTRDGIIAGI